MSIRKLFRNSFLTVGEKFITALIQFVSIPVLFSAYGKESYGLIALAASLNVFLGILNFGLPMGFPKFVAEWLAARQSEQMYSVSGTILSFYLVIGVVNSLCLLLVAWGGVSLFNVTPEQMPIMRSLLVVTAVTALFSMPANYLDQVLSGAQDLGFVSLMQVAKNGLFILLIAYIHFFPQALSLLWFYILQNLLTFCTVFFKIRRWRSFGSYRIFRPGWDVKGSVPVVKYCLALMTFSIFILLDNATKPLIIGTMGEQAGRQMADFQIISTFRMFLMLLATSLMQVLIPYLSHQRVLEGERVYHWIISQGTRIIWAAGALVGWLVILQAANILTLYVGAESRYLAPLITVYVAASLYNIYITGAAAAVLSSGRVAPMVWTTCAGFAVSTVISLALVKSWQLDAIVYSLVGYNAVHFLVMHFYYLPTQFRIKPLPQMLNVAAPPVAAGLFMYWLTGYLLQFLAIGNIYWEMAAGTVIGTAIYLTVIFSIYIRPRDVREWVNEIMVRRKREVPA